MGYQFNMNEANPSQCWHVELNQKLLIGPDVIQENSCVTSFGSYPLWGLLRFRVFL